MDLSSRTSAELEEPAPADLQDLSLELSDGVLRRGVGHRLPVEAHASLLDQAAGGGPGGGQTQGGHELREPDQPVLPLGSLHGNLRLLDPFRSTSLPVDPVELLLGLGPGAGYSSTTARAIRRFSSIGLRLPSTMPASILATSEGSRSAASRRYLVMRWSGIRMSLPNICSGGSVSATQLSNDFDILRSPSIPSSSGMVKTI